MPLVTNRTDPSINRVFTPRGVVAAARDRGVGDAGCVLPLAHRVEVDVVRDAAHGSEHLRVRREAGGEAGLVDAGIDPLGVPGVDLELAADCDQRWSGQSVPARSAAAGLPPLRKYGVYAFTSAITEGVARPVDDRCRGISARDQLCRAGSMPNRECTGPRSGRVRVEHQPHAHVGPVVERVVGHRPVDALAIVDLARAEIDRHAHLRRGKVDGVGVRNGERHQLLEVLLLDVRQDDRQGRVRDRRCAFTYDPAGGKHSLDEW